MDFTKTIIPLALMASESIDSEPIRARGIIVNDDDGNHIDIDGDVHDDDDMIMMMMIMILL